MQYHKLVRDRIPEIIRKNGGDPKFHYAVCIVFERALREKLREEVEEFLYSKKRTEMVEEIADVLEVLEEFCVYYRISKREVAKEKSKKARAKGKFKKRIILEEA